MRFQEFTAADLAANSNRGDNPFDPHQIRYLGFGFRSKNAYFNVGKYNQTVKIPDMKVISKMRGADTTKVGMALESDVLVKCSCPDYKYGGFQYMGTATGYNTARPEKRRPDIRNPDLKGSVCKHLTYLLQELPRFVDAIVRDIEHARTINYRVVRREAKAMTTKNLIERVRNGMDPMELIENLFMEFDKYSPADLMKLATEGEVDTVIDYLIGEGHIKVDDEFANKLRDYSATPDNKLGTELLSTMEMWAGSMSEG